SNLEYCQIKCRLTIFLTGGQYRSETNFQTKPARHFSKMIQLTDVRRREGEPVTIEQDSRRTVPWCKMETTPGGAACAVLCSLLLYSPARRCTPKRSRSSVRPSRPLRPISGEFSPRHPSR